MITISGPAGGIALIPGAHNADTAEDAIEVVCGVAFRMKESWPYAQARFARAMEVLHATDIGATLCHAIAALDIPDAERPSVFFHDYDDFCDETASEYKHRYCSDTTVIPFCVLRRGTIGADGQPGVFDASDIDQVDQIVQLFRDLVDFHAARTGSLPGAAASGLARFSPFALREQLGHPLDEWEVDMRAYIHADPGAFDPRQEVYDRTAAYVRAGNYEAPLDLNCLELKECPPLRKVAALTKVILSNNWLVAFPPRDALPEAIVLVDLGNNPLQAGAASYGPHLRLVTVGGRGCDAAALRAAMPAHVRLSVVEQLDDVQRSIETARILRDFVSLADDIVPVEDMERAGLTHEAMGAIYPDDMLTQAVKAWIPAPNESWAQLQKQDLLAALAFRSMLRRLGAIADKDGPAFRAEIAALIDKMQQPGNKAFQARCVEIARNGAETCADRVVMTLNDLYTASLNADAEAGLYDHNIRGLLDLAESMLNREVLSEFIVARMPELRKREEEVDEIDAFVHLQKRLYGEIKLPIIRADTAFQHPALLSDEDVDLARVQLRARQQTGFVDFLTTWAPMTSVIGRLAPGRLREAQRRRARIHTDRGLLYRALERLLNRKGTLFVHDKASDLSVFKVPYRIFWTRYERLIDKRLRDSELAHRRNAGPMDTDIVLQLGAVVADEVQRSTMRPVVRRFLAAHGIAPQPRQTH
ncbi:NEL-type E3 ubiquitin ligase domain-containing protein [Bordetella flabilis]|uniref:NEL domain-containing protein n=1 Tax=Bordetella flabilis TaxID=463014 RepID=A0A193G9Q9_9BORD|nr:NEL-type E3 ubiquitin ligase domain-containing protein [Bordetella flabilis]ANN76009.1 hypothetical protein BAU07_01715 [Bordetella flabilis]